LGLFFFFSQKKVLNWGRGWHIRPNGRSPEPVAMAVPCTRENSLEAALVPGEQEQPTSSTSSTEQCQENIEVVWQSVSS